MDNSEIFQDYSKQLNKLKEIVNKTYELTISDPPQEYFADNVNFFTKSFFVNLCAYLESFLKDIIFSCIQGIDEKLKNSEIPYNLIIWALNSNKKFKDSEYKFSNLSVGIKKKDLDDHISGSPYRTVELFKKVGINLDADQDFHSKKEKINSIVVKRNKILHHNDNASDISFQDINSNIDEVLAYMMILDNCVENFKK